MINYNQYGVPYQSGQQAPAYQSPVYQNGGQFYFISSKEEAERWIVGQGQTVYLFDVNNQCFYIKAVAKNGLPQPLEKFDYKKAEEEEKAPEAVNFATIEQLKDVKESLEKEIKKLKPIKKAVKKDE